jgi:drug/metabolite transporter (DMT)-like permease
MSSFPFVEAPSIVVAPPAPQMFASGHWRAIIAAASAGTGAGVGAALVAAVIWGGALAMTRLGVSGDGVLSPHDIAVLRFLLPAVVLLPVFVRALPKLRTTNRGVLVAILAGGGVPFVLVAGTGLRVSAAAEAGALLPGAMPLCVAALSAFLGERPGWTRLLGLGLIMLAVVVVAGPSAVSNGSVAWQGHVLLLAAAVLAAGYTVGLRYAGLSPWEATAFVSVCSIAAFIPFYLVILEPQVFTATWKEIALQATYQGMISGLVAPIAFAMAVTRLGASRAAAFGGLSPIAAAFFGFVLLGELPHATTLLGVAFAGFGVALVSSHPNVQVSCRASSRSLLAKR